MGFEPAGETRAAWPAMRGQPAATGTRGVANVVDANTRTLRLSDMALLSIRRPDPDGEAPGRGYQGALMGASVAPLSEGVASQAAALPGCVAVAFHPRLGRCCGRRSLAMTAGRVSGVRQHKRFVALADDVARCCANVGVPLI